MLGKKIVWKLFFTQIALVLISLTVIGFYVSFSLRGHYIGEIASQLESSAILTRDLAKEDIRKGNGAGINFLAKRVGREIHSRITIINPEGVVLGDSEEDPQNMENHRDRPEIIEAMEGRTGRITRYSPTLKQEMMYLALPIYGDSSRIVGTVRVSLSLDELKHRIASIYKIVGLGGLLAVMLSLGLVFIVAQRVSNPIRQVARAAKKISRGDFSERIRIDSEDEVGDLARSFNVMSEELESKIESLVREVSEKEVVLSSMIEGVIAVDQEERVILFNRALQKMLELPPNDTLGRFHWEAVRNPEINNLFKKVLRTRKQKTIEFSFTPLKEKIFRVQAAPIVDSGGTLLGVVTVLHDITEIKRLEKVRMEFVANVSHELRTPLTSIMGAAETLKNGAIDDKKDALTFLNVIERHTDRLNRLIADLLDLSRVETGKKKMEFGPIKILDLAEKAVCGFQEAAKKKFLEIIMDIPPDLPLVLADEEEIETVLSNFLDNALKYTPKKGKITLGAVEKDGFIETTVADNGTGIPKKDLPRIFERFYQVDKDRSRELGGTGLGLSIVKHIIEAHGGTVKAESEEGKGTIFTFTLPISQDL